MQPLLCRGSPKRRALQAGPLDRSRSHPLVTISDGRPCDRTRAEEARLFPSLTVVETISVALERHLASKDLIAAGLRLPASLDSEAEVAEKVRELIETIGLAAYAEKLLGELSTGTRRIVELACVIAQDPAVVLLDEPSGGSPNARPRRWDHFSSGSSSVQGVRCS